MNKWLTFLFSFMVLLGSTACTTTSDISRRAIFKDIVGHPVKTKEPINLLAPNASLSGYGDRYDLNSACKGCPAVAVVPAGHTVLFQRAVHRSSSPDGGDEVCLLGTLDLDGKTYPIVYSIPTFEDNDAVRLKVMHYDFVF